MGKVVDGVELLRMIRDGELKKETKLKSKNGKIYVFNGTSIADEETNEFLLTWLDEHSFANMEFEILSEEDEELDIDSIEELYISNIKSVGESEIKCWTGRNLDIVLANKINELLKAVKQLNKQLNEPIDNHIPRID